MKNRNVILIIAAALLLSSPIIKIASCQFEAYDGIVSPPSDVSPPQIIILSPINNNTFSENKTNLVFTLNYSVPMLPEIYFWYLHVSEVYYKASWLPNNTQLDLTALENSIPHRTTIVSQDFYPKWSTWSAIPGYQLAKNFSISLSDIPDGAHSLEVYAVLSGSRETSYQDLTYHYGSYSLIGSASVNFTIDTLPKTTPSINIDSGLDYRTNIFLYAIGITIFLILVGGLVVYFKKRKR